MTVPELSSRLGSFLPSPRRNRTTRFPGHGSSIDFVTFPCIAPNVKIIFLFQVGTPS